MSTMGNMARDTAKDARDAVKETSKVASAGAKDIQEDLEALRDDVAHRRSSSRAFWPPRATKPGAAPSRMLEV